MCLLLTSVTGRCREVWVGAMVLPVPLRMSKGQCSGHSARVSQQTGAGAGPALHEGTACLCAEKPGQPAVQQTRHAAVQGNPALTRSFPLHSANDPNTLAFQFDICLRASSFTGICAPPFSRDPLWSSLIGEVGPEDERSPEEMGSE